jgi:hypothetical protein
MANLMVTEDIFKIALSMRGSGRTGSLTAPESNNVQATACGVDGKKGGQTWSGPWSAGKSCKGNKCCWLMGPNFTQFYSASNKYSQLGKQFAVLPLSRPVTSYEQKLVKVFSTDKIAFHGHSEDFKGYTKELGNFDVT